MCRGVLPYSKILDYVKNNLTHFAKITAKKVLYYPTFEDKMRNMTGCQEPSEDPWIDFINILRS